MGLVRRRQELFYYRTERIGRSGWRYYVGSGLVARMAGETDAYFCERRAARQAMLDRQVADLKALVAKCEELSTRIDILVRVRLLLAGRRFNPRRKNRWRHGAKD